MKKNLSYINYILKQTRSPTLSTYLRDVILGGTDGAAGLSAHVGFPFVILCIPVYHWQFRIAIQALPLQVISYMKVLFSYMNVTTIIYESIHFIYHSYMKTGLSPFHIPFIYEICSFHIWMWPQSYMKAASRLDRVRITLWVHWDMEKSLSYHIEGGGPDTSRRSVYPFCIRFISF
jgi:hypothetical protein